jgi:hypothetical protein
MIILYAYYRGITSSQKIAQCCRENVIFMALSEDTQPHFTTISDFISTSGQEITHLFLEILSILCFPDLEQIPDGQKAASKLKEKIVLVVILVLWAAMILGRFQMARQ